MAQDMTKKTFNKALRGYSPEEVDAYIDSLLRRYHAVSNENEENKKKLVAVLQKLRALSDSQSPDSDSPKQVPSAESEEASRQIIEQAQEEARRIIENAEKNAQDIIRSAQTEARNKAVMITAEARQSATDAEIYAKTQYEAAEKLYREIFAFRDKLFGMYNSHIEMIENIAGEANTYFDTVCSAGEAFLSASADGVKEIASSVEEPSDAVEEAAEMTDHAAVEAEASDGPDGFTEEFLEVPEETVVDVPAVESMEDAVDFAEEFTDFSEDFVEAPEETAAEEIREDGDEFVEDPMAMGENESPFLMDESDGLEEFFASELFSEDENEPDSDYLSLLSNEEPEEEEPEIRIDWSLRHSANREDESEDFEFFDEAVMTETEEEEDDFHDFDQLFSKEIDDSEDYSLTDEFDIVYSSRSSTDNVREIERQPLVSPEPPSNPKKHKRF